MFLGLGVESRGKKREGPEGSATQASSRSFGGEDLSVLPEGHWPPLLETLTYRHRTTPGCCK